MGVLERSAADTAARRDRFARFLVATITVATFGPYLFSGLRTEQLVIYLIGVLTIPVLGGLRPAGGLRFLVPWLLYIVIASLAVLMPSGMVAPQQPGSLLAGFDNIVTPLLIMLIVWTLVPEASAPGVLTMFGKLLASIMALNGVVAIIATRVDITSLLRPFWASTGPTEGTVAALAQMMGRYGGIFNQPAEAGVAYSLAGVAAIFVWKHRPGVLALVLVPITIGGLICVSKVFVLGGLPVIIVYWLIAQRHGGRRIATVFALGLAALGVLQSGLLGQWTGFNYLARLINPDSDGGALAFYTAGRLSANSTYNNVIGDALGYSPVVGVGAGGWAVPYDGTIPETLVVGGIIGLTLYAVVIVGMFTLARKGAPTELRQFAFFIAVVVTGGCFGLSPLTANRVSTLIWVLIALLVLARRALATADDDQRGPSRASARPAHEGRGRQRER